MKNKMLSQSVTDNIMTMITVEKRFSVGDKLLNELELAEELNVSRQLYGKCVEEGIRQNRDRTFQSCQRTNAGHYGRICGIDKEDRREPESIFYWSNGKRYLSVFVFSIGIIPPYLPYRFRQ